MKVEDIYAYYASSDFKPEMPTSPGFRHYRFRLSEGGWRKVPVKIHTAEELQKWAVKFGAVDIYYSTSQWLNPHKISSKGSSGRYFIADNLLINNDLVFDVDCKSPVSLENLDKARKSTSNIYEVMKDERAYKLQYIEFTGMKGFRLVYEDCQINLPGDPRKRLDFVENKRKVYIEELLKRIKESASNQQIYKQEAFLDKKITTNVMCVIRVLGSVHSKTGYLSTKISPKQLRTPIKKLLNQIPHIGKRRPVILSDKEMKRSDKGLERPSPRLLSKREDVSGLASSSPFKYFITNRVLGIKKGFIPVFIYQDHQNGVEKELEYLQKKYKLGHIYLFKDGNESVAVSLKTMQKRNLEKCLNESRSRTKITFKKYKRIWIKFALQPTEVIRGEHTGHLSRGHSKWVNPNRPDKPIFCGWPQLEFIRAKVE